jgi:hypothetical protein
MFQTFKGAIGGVAKVGSKKLTPVWNLAEQFATNLRRGEGVEDEDQEDEPYSDRARKDQILHFFEYEFERHEGYIPLLQVGQHPDPKQTRKAIDDMRVAYYNCIDGIDFQNEVIADLVDTLVSKRKQFRAERRKEILMEINSVKLDITDRKTKRYFKDQDRRKVAADITPYITEMKLQKLLYSQKEIEEEEMKQHKAPPALSSSNDGVGGGWARSSSASIIEAAGTAMRMRSNKTVKLYSDKELSALLKHVDG